MEKDLTIIYLTASKVPETFARKQREVLLEAADGAPIIAVSRVGLDYGYLQLLDRERKCLSNIYWQMLRAARHANTPYVAIAEDDTFYPREHFQFHRPAADTFAYNQNRLALFTWGPPVYHWRNRKSNCSLIAPRPLLIEALEERFAKWPDGTPDEITGEVGRHMVEKNMGITLRKSEEVFSKVSLIQFNHEAASEERQRTHRKSYGPLRMYDIPRWRHARDLVQWYR
jgi:hypothetical protein